MALTTVSTRLLPVDVDTPCNSFPVLHTPSIDICSDRLSLMASSAAPSPFFGPVCPQYIQLRQQRREIRLIDLSPSFKRANDKARCTLKPHDFLSVRSRVYSLDHLQLPDAVPYCAISYTWGPDTEPRKKIKLNGSIVLISRNLEDALVHLLAYALTDKQECCLFWCDALCINQEDSIEKTRQVRMMRKIYEIATLVRIWLGSGDEAVERALRQMGDVAPELHEGMFPRTNELGTWISRRLFLRSGPIVDMDDIVRLNSIAWWGRAWVVQEFLVTKVAVFHYGNIAIPRQSLYMAWMASNELILSLGDNSSPVSFEDPRRYIQFFREVDPSLSTDRMSRIVILDQEYVQFNQGRMPENQRASLCLPDMLFHHSQAAMAAVDARDLVFSLLGLAIDSESFNIVPDYTISEQEVFITTAVALLQRGLVRTLSLCQETRTMENIPSWTPDWTGDLLSPISSSCTYPGTMVSGICDGMDLYKACPDNLAWAPRFSPPGPYPQYLSVSGFLFDEVLICGEASHYGGPCRNTCEYLRSLESWERFHERFRAFCRAYGKAYPSLVERLGVCWRTPIADAYMIDVTATYNRRRTIPSDVEGYNELLAKPSDNPPTRKAVSYLVAAIAGMGRRRPFATKKGYIGVGPRDMREGDSVVLICGLEAPMILRRLQNGRYIVIGDSYVHGIMDGEFMDDPNAMASTIVLE